MKIYLSIRPSVMSIRTYALCQFDMKKYDIFSRIFKGIYEIKASFLDKQISRHFPRFPFLTIVNGPDIHNGCLMLYNIVHECFTLSFFSCLSGTQKTIIKNANSGIKKYTHSQLFTFYEGWTRSGCI